MQNIVDIPGGAIYTLHRQMQNIFYIVEAVDAPGVCTIDTDTPGAAFGKTASAFLPQRGTDMKNDKMKQKRQLLGMSQTDLAKAAGVTRQSIGLIEAGEFNPSIKLCIAICRALGATLDELFWEDPEIPEKG